MADEGRLFREKEDVNKRDRETEEKTDKRYRVRIRDEDRKGQGCERDRIVAGGKGRETKNGR